MSVSPGANLVCGSRAKRSPMSFNRHPVPRMASTYGPLEALNLGLAIGAVIVVAVRRALRALEDRRGTDPSYPTDEQD